MRLHLHFIALLIIFILVIGAGSYAYQKVEGWNSIDATYFVVITITTIGYGDIHPETDFGKGFTIFFSFFGIALAFYMVSVVGNYIFEKELQKSTDKIRQHLYRQEKKQTEELKKK